MNEGVTVDAQAIHCRRARLFSSGAVLFTALHRQHPNSTRMSDIDNLNDRVAVSSRQPSESSCYNRRRLDARRANHVASRDSSKNEIQFACDEMSRVSHRSDLSYLWYVRSLAAFDVKHHVSLIIIRGVQTTPRRPHAARGLYAARAQTRVINLIKAAGGEGLNHMQTVQKFAGLLEDRDGEYSDDSDVLYHINVGLRWLSLENVFEKSGI